MSIFNIFKKKKEEETAPIPCDICGIDYRAMALFGPPVIVFGCGPSFEKRKKAGKALTYVVCGPCAQVLGPPISEVPVNEAGSRMITFDLDEIDKRREEIKHTAKAIKDNG